MNITDIMTEKNIFIGLKVNGKRDLLQEIASKIAERSGLDERTIFDTLLERESLGSTGFGSGVALPHGRFSDLDKVQAYLFKTSSPVDFEAIDNKPVDLLFVLISPEDSGADHLTALAQISRILKDEGICSQLRQMNTPLEIFALLNNLN